LKRELLADGEIRRYLSSTELDTIWSVKQQLTHVDFIFRRVFQ
jgi:hypothetical protein